MEMKVAIQELCDAIEAREVMCVLERGFTGGNTGRVRKEIKHCLTCVETRRYYDPTTHLNPNPNPRPNPSLITIDSIKSNLITNQVKSKSPRSHVGVK